MNEPKQVQVEDEGVAGLFGWYISYYTIINKFTSCIYEIRN